MYEKKQSINDIHRIYFTFIRVSGHSLDVETGQWNRRGRGRLPMEERLCVCVCVCVYGDIKTEQHVVEKSPQTKQINSNGFTQLFLKFSKIS